MEFLWLEARYHFTGVTGDGSDSFLGSGSSSSKSNISISAPMLSERFSLIVTVYSDHKPESACTTGLDPCHGIFNDDGLFRLDSQASCRLQERVRGGLSLKTKAIDLMPINAHVK
jgi:hypothetical protein